jgi:hypothetical protein
MLPSPTNLTQSIDEQGFAILPSVYVPEEVDRITALLELALNDLNDDRARLKTSQATVYAARNVLEWFPLARSLWCKDELVGLLGEVLGPGFGLVRALYFDKPPQKSWSLPWHQDRAIAVQDNRLPSTHFSHPTVKAGVQHVEASANILANMLTLRLHLDDVDQSNGPLSVMAGSHRSEQGDAENAGPIHQILVARGDVLAMRPLLSHSSQASRAGTRRHRRILHFEFAGNERLPDGYRWHTFFRP